jgi:hypothetical protein
MTYLITSHSVPHSQFRRRACLRTGALPPAAETTCFRHTFALILSRAYIHMRAPQNFKDMIHAIAICIEAHVHVPRPLLLRSTCFSELQVLRLEEPAHLLPSGVLRGHGLFP